MYDGVVRLSSLRSNLFRLFHFIPSRPDRGLWLFLDLSSSWLRRSTFSQRRACVSLTHNAVAPSNPPFNRHAPERGSDGKDCADSNSSPSYLLNPVCAYSSCSHCIRSGLHSYRQWCGPAQEPCSGSTAAAATAYNISVVPRS